MLAAYFYFSTFLASLTGVLSVATGKNGFALTPYMNALFAMSIFIVLTWLLYSRLIYSRHPAVLHRSAVPILIPLTAVLCLGFVIGTVSGNPKIYVISTTIYWLNWALYLVFASQAGTIADSQMDRLIKSLAIIAICLATLSIPVSNETKLFLLTAAIILAIQGRFRFAVLCIVPLLLSFENVNRGTLLSGMAAMIFALAAFRKGGRLLIALGLFLTAFVWLETADLAKIINPTAQLYRRLVEVQQLASGSADIQSIVALQQRFFEIRLVNEFLAQGWIETLFGGGFGKTVDMRSTQDVAVASASLLGNNAVHNIHSLPHSLMLRNGYLGLLLLVTLVLAILRNIFLLWRSGRKEFALVLCCIYPASSFVYALPASNYFLTDFIVAGMIVYAARELSFKRGRYRGQRNLVPIARQEKTIAINQSGTQHGSN
jgi:hypothetical protein